MAIREFLPISRALYGDGESTTITIDFADEIDQSKICCGAPLEIKDAVSDAGDVKATVSGTKVTFELAAAPTGIFTLTGELLFGEEHKAKSHAHAKPHTTKG